MLFIIIASIILFSIMGVGFYLIHKEIKKSEVKFSGNKFKTSTSVQEELGFEEIRNGILALGNHRYRLVIEVFAVNYRLQSEIEQDRIESGFNQFINSLSWPVQIHIQSRKLDMSDLINKQNSKISRVVDKYPQLKHYAESYINNISNLPEFIGTNVVKRNYIIIGYDGVGSLAKLTDDEKFNEAARELSNRMTTITDGLKRIGVKCKPLNSLELAELLFSTWNKDRVGHENKIISGESFNTAVKGIYDYIPPKTTEEKAWDILLGLETMINNDEENGENPVLGQIIAAINNLKKTADNETDPVISKSIPA